MNQALALALAGLPNYLCQKRVRAVRIVSVNRAYDVAGTEGSVTVALEGQPSVTVDVPIGFFGRGVPQPGDYLVVYEPDGYMSWSPKAKFEDGYTLAEPAGEPTYGDMINGLAYQLTPDNLPSYARTMREIEALARKGAEEAEAGCLLTGPGVRPHDGTGMDFGQALLQLRAGMRVARAGWNGKGMWIAYTPGSAFAPEHAKPGHAAAHRAKEAPNELVVLLSHIDMRAPDGSMIIGWRPDTLDMLTDDWMIVGAA